MSGESFINIWAQIATFIRLLPPIGSVSRPFQMGIVVFLFMTFMLLAYNSLFMLAVAFGAY